MSTLRRLPQIVRLRVDPSPLAGPRLVHEGDAPWPPPGWMVARRESCAGGHPSDEDCDLCRGEAIPEGA